MAEDLPQDVSLLTLAEARGRDDIAAVPRTVAFAIALALLLVVSRSGSSILTIQVAVTLFVIASTIWIRGQYVDSLDRTQWVVPKSIGIALLAIAVVLVLIHLIYHTPNVLLAATLIGYFLAGAFLTRLRGSLQSSAIWLRRLGPALAIAGAILAIIGISLLGSVSTAVGLIVDYALIGSSLLILLPVGTALLSEAAILRLERSGFRLSLWLGIAGTALLAVSAGLLYWLSRSWWLLGGLVAIALLVVAVVSTTQADIAAVMGAVALMGVTPLPADQPPELQPDSNPSGALVALGDSYMSGEGASIYYNGTDEGGRNQCHRSPTAWVAMAGQQRPFRKLEFLACSGARTVNLQSEENSPPGPGSLKPQPQAGEEYTQLDAYAHNHEGTTNSVPSLVVVSIGGNDAGFSTIGLMCLAPGNCDDKSSLWTGSLEQVRQNLRRTYRQIDAAFPHTPVAVIPYPDPIKPDGRCDDLALSPRERQFLHSFVTGDGAGIGLDRVIAETAGEFGFHTWHGWRPRSLTHTCGCVTHETRDGPV